MAMTEMEKVKEKLSEIDPLSRQTAEMVGRLDKVYNDLSGQIEDLRTTTQSEMQAMRSEMATKDDLQQLRLSTQSEMQAMRNEMATKDDLQQLRLDTQKDIQDLRTTTQSEMQAMRSEMAVRFDAVMMAIGQLTASINTLKDAQAAVEITAHRTAADVAALKLVK